MRVTRSLSGAAALAVSLSVSVHAQQAQGAISLIGGSATDVMGVTSRAVTLAPSLSVAPDPRLVLGVDASATRYDNQQWSLGAGATGATRAPLGRFAALTLNAGLTGGTTSYDFSYATAGALPAIEVSAGPISAFGGARVAMATTRSAATAAVPAGPFRTTPIPSQSLASTSRSSDGAILGARGRLVGADGETIIVGVREERATIDTVPTVDRSASLSVLKGIVTLGGSIGVRTEPGTTRTFGSAALSVAVSPAASLELSAGSYPADRLIGTPAGHYLNLGLSLSTHGGGTPAPSRIDGLPSPVAGLTRLAIRAEGATRVEVAGDFTNWRSIAAARAPGNDGIWFIDLRIPPGQYRFAFRIDGQRWVIPDGATAVDDDFGGKSAWLTVSAPGNTVR